MRIAILGTRGIPNNHGGFEQFAEYLSQYLYEKGHEVYVYNSQLHPYQETIWKGVNIVHCKDLEDKLGTFGQFIYDFNCIRDSRKRKFDIILQLGYTSSSVWGWYLPNSSVIVTNMDGLEWKRTKYRKGVRRFLKYAEKLAVKTSDYFVSDSIGIQKYLSEKYNLESVYIPYGANVFESPIPEVIKKYGLTNNGYNMLIARLEPENNIETVLDGHVLSESKIPFLVIGKHETKYGEYLKKKYSNNKCIRFLGGIYNNNHLNNLRFFSNLYFHGHSVGGTNPSLLEAMASGALIAAHNNVFNRSILGQDAVYFKSSEDVSKIMNVQKSECLSYVRNNTDKVVQFYSWSKINQAYEEYLVKCFAKQ
ncbi:DUF1972 domain-containing protein [Flagellimonas oceanensis]|uniref:DUF1972 domain-containing protein n=1 Tax=Flagellimonas oceanensis TaxID=2499163 RepID=UPI000F8DA112|nr:DUF1972 domain-containing protein [Allomuricauda oceanensis]